MPAIARATAFDLPFASGYFHSIITSPPYFGLRDYHGEQIVNWPAGEYSPMPGIPWLEQVGEWRGALGAEETLSEYIFHITLIARDLKRVLRDDGVLWFNISDSYNGSGGAGGDYGVGGIREGQPRYPGRDLSFLGSGNMLGVPWRVAFALQADGWTLRNDVIWNKTTVLPEPRKGWSYERPPCDCNHAAKEERIADDLERTGGSRHTAGYGDKKPGDIPFDPECPKCHGTGKIKAKKHRISLSSWRHTKSHEYLFMFTKGMGYFSDHHRVQRSNHGINPRDVVSPKRDNYKGEHFAVFPTGLVSPLILATVPIQTCGACGTPLAPVVETEIDQFSGERYQRVVGYKNVCIHNSDSGRGRVLDPFFGSGTTGLVAQQAGVNWAGVDISLEYLRDQAVKRATGRIPESIETYSDLPLFMEDDNA